MKCICGNCSEEGMKRREEKYPLMSKEEKTADMEKRTADLQKLLDWMAMRDVMLV